MSNTIYEKDEVGTFSITAFVGERGDASIQITTRNDYVQFTREEALEMAFIILARATRQVGYRATD